MHKALWALNNDVPASELANAIDVSTEQAEFVYKDIENKRNTTAYLHYPAMLVR